LFVFLTNKNMAERGMENEGRRHQGESPKIIEKKYRDSKLTGMRLFILATALACISSVSAKCHLESEERKSLQQLENGSPESPKPNQSGDSSLAMFCDYPIDNALCIGVPSDDVPEFVESGMCVLLREESKSACNVLWDLKDGIFCGDGNCNGAENANNCSDCR
jgi:hypothetical protein